ncbi:MAG TPA: 4Fe-4S dicluster domain-containing protein [Syntrophorhabdaceae bacterium]|nr:4Fe-4S dicluster domain-containing protein [Syntrophorhabdaceae bacterium]
MAKTGFLPKEKVRAFLDALSKDAVVHVPVAEGEVVSFKPYRTDTEICLSRPANTSPKSVIYPQCDRLISFTYTKDPEDPKKSSVAVSDARDYSKAVIFGCRPCDAKGFTIFDRVFIETDTADPYYQEHREKTTIVSLACETPFAGCFCVAVNGGPVDKTGSDVLMTDTGKGYYLESGSEKGDALLNLPMIESGAPYEKEAHKIQKEAIPKVKNPFPADATATVNATLFDTDEFWQQVAAKCVSCGACTYLCPTCYCFNITDEQARDKGERLRTWDACMFQHFTLEASGHNPRPAKSRRLRNRVGHKFSYYPEKYSGAIACCGCGRCIRHCPVSVDISEIAGYLKDPKQDPKKWVERNTKA